MNTLTSKLSLDLFQPVLKSLFIDVLWMNVWEQHFLTHVGNRSGRKSLERTILMFSEAKDLPIGKVSPSCKSLLTIGSVVVGQDHVTTFEAMLTVAMDFLERILLGKVALIYSLIALLRQSNGSMIRLLAWRITRLRV
jgi:hypothetical protein